MNILISPHDETNKLNERKRKVSRKIALTKAANDATYPAPNTKQASNHRIRIRLCRRPFQRVSLIIRLPTLNIGRSNPSNDRTKPTDPTDRHQQNWHFAQKTFKGCQRTLYFLLIRYLTPKSAYSLWPTEYRRFRTTRRIQIANTHRPSVRPAVFAFIRNGLVCLARNPEVQHFLCSRIALVKNSSRAFKKIYPIRF